ncbi:MAG: hydrogenase nickel incorporation protein HypB [Oscillospiraceae bacterium]|nr:hydrogenase nickel incorporation protein HypB [Oscillospiraceae bacterium]
MSEVRVITINQSVFAQNDRSAEIIRKNLTEQGTLFLNFMSSPGSGKTTTLVALINRLKGRLNIGEMDVDIESSLDAQRVADLTGVRSLQIHNGGLCHIDADMTARALVEYDTKGLDLLILENIGNLVCPAEFDTGAHKNVTILSVPEGDDKPLKYPLMYQVSDVVLINKIDTLDYFDFNPEKAKSSILALNPNAVFFPISAKTGEGLDAVCDWILAEVDTIKSGIL